MPGIYINTVTMSKEPVVNETFSISFRFQNPGNTPATSVITKIRVSVGTAIGGQPNWNDPEIVPVNMQTLFPNGPQAYTAEGGTNVSVSDPRWPQATSLRSAY